MVQCTPGPRYGPFILNTTILRAARALHLQRRGTAPQLKVQATAFRSNSIKKERECRGWAAARVYQNSVWL